MNKKTLLLTLILITATILSGCSLTDNQQSDPTDMSTTQEPAPDNPQTMDGITDQEMMNYTLEEIALHDNKDDCWLAIKGKVYDVTAGIEKHPGGEAILEGCGIDATELFTTRPMGSGTEHSPEAYSYLENYYLGDLQN